MKSRTVNEVLVDICERCGYSEDIVREVLKAETDSALERLKHGERATLMGRCALIPSIGGRLGIGAVLESEIRVKADTHAIELRLRDITEFEESTRDEDVPEHILTTQIPGLV